MKTNEIIAVISKMEEQLAELKSMVLAESNENPTEETPVIEDEVEDITSQVLLEKGKDLYLDGEYEEGLKWVRKAADLDNVDALNFLAEKYKLGCDVPLDIAEAVRCYKRAVELGDDFAQLQLDLMKMLGVIE